MGIFGEHQEDYARKVGSNLQIPTQKRRPLALSRKNEYTFTLSMKIKYLKYMSFIIILSLNDFLKRVYLLFIFLEMGRRREGGRH